MGSKKSNKNADVQNAAKTKSRTQNKIKAFKIPPVVEQEIDIENEPTSSAAVDGSVFLRRSPRKKVNKNDVSIDSSKQIKGKKSTKRNAEEETGCEPKRKKVVRERSKSASKSESVKKKYVRKIRKKNSSDVDKLEKSAVQLDSNGGIHQLPVEILTEIFTYLSSRDRRNTRLVCRRWFEANNVIQFSYDEKLLCYALYDYDVVIRTLEKSQRKILNLEFYDMNFDDLSRGFWEKCGSKIESLLFSDCILSGRTIKYVVEYCDKLKCLSIENMSPRDGGEKICSDVCLDELIDSQVRRDSLYFFELNINETKWISNNFLRALFAVYPNIRQFSFYCDTVEDDFNTGDVSDEALLRSTESCTFTAILRKLIDSHSELDSITLDVGDYQTLEFPPASQICAAVAPLYFPELRDIKIDLESLNYQEHLILDFFSRHKQLQYVECQVLFETVTADFIEELINCLLDSCPHLQTLQILQDGSLNISITLDSSVFTKLRKSKLDSLSLNFDLEIPPSDQEIVNYELRSLSILPPPIRKDTFLTLCKTFCGLTHLEIFNIDDEGLQSILHHQHYLTSLKLIDFDCTDYGFTGCRSEGENEDWPKGYSIRRLDKLQYLELKICDTPKITEKTLAEFRFPNLNYLHVTIENSWELCQDFVKTFSNLPNIEGLFCDVDEDIDYSVWFDLCRRLKKLRYLHMQLKEFESFGDRRYRRIFDCCPSLRAIQHRGLMGGRSQSYYYDVVKRRVVKKTSDREYRITSEQIDTFSVNWMWF